MTQFFQAITWSINTIANFFNTLFSWIMSIIVFLWDAINFIIYAIKTIFSLFTSIF